MKFLPLLAIALLLPASAIAETLRIGAVSLEYSSQHIELLSVDRSSPDRTRLTIRRKKAASPALYDLRIAASKAEYFSGVTERVVGGPEKLSWQPSISTGLNLRGQRVPVVVEDTLGLFAPFFLSSRNYAVWVKGTWPGVFDFCKRDPRFVELSWEGPEIQLEILLGKNPLELVRTFTVESGPPVMLPDWAFRPWRWRNTLTARSKYFNGEPVAAPFNSEILEDILIAEHFDIPIGVYWIDRPWSHGALGYADFKFDENRIPHADAMISWLGKKGIKLGLWLAPWLTDSLGRSAKARGHTLDQEIPKGQDQIYPLDFTNPAARAHLQSLLAPLLARNVKVFKLDRGDEMLPRRNERNVFSGVSQAENANAYCGQYQQTIFDECVKAYGSDFALLSRAGYPGSSKFTAIWGGDIEASEWGLRASIIGVQRAALIGYPFWGSDTGGYGGKLDREVVARWLAFSAFTPIMEVGPLRDRAPWDMPVPGTEPEPGKPTPGIYDRELLAVYRLYSKVHEELVPYTALSAKYAVSEGTPIVRPLFLMYPDSAESWRVWDEFMYGSEILVAPLWKKGETKRSVYLPPGEEWFDAWDGTVHKGGSTIVVDAPLFKVPVFLKYKSRGLLGDLKSIFEDSKRRVETPPVMRELELGDSVLR